MAQSASAIDIPAGNGAMVANGLGMPKAQFPFPESSCSDPGSPASAASVPVCAVEPPSVSDSQLTLRALVSTKEAGVIIGKGGRNVANLREIANVKAGVSKVVPGVHDRVLSVTGFLSDVAHAYHLVAQTLVDNPLAVATHAGLQQPASPMQTVVRILIAHNLMGTIIGRQGLKIKHIQDASGARLVATKEMLPQSTERVVEIHGNVEGIRIAIEEIGKCLIEDWERGIGTILYNPATRVPTVTSNANPYVNNVRASYDFTHSDADRVGGLGAGPMSVAMAAMNRHRSHTVSVTRASASDFLASSIPMPPQQLHHQQQPLSFSAAVNGGATTPPHLVSSAAALAGARLRSQSVSIQAQRGIDPSVIMANIRTQQITIPCDMVGCIIGKGGSRISEIRRLSGSRISIAKVSESDGGERLFTIKGTPECNERALYLLYGQLEAEREFRIANAHMMANLESINEHIVAED
ncbi:RNA binding protein, heterogenous nuclear RNP-K like protein [Coemansia sp. RSA 1822]|nr:RNA binding protein, heterogenous nuclear RNP-K like protein [Coemansia sp. RSA 638]KAJ2120975.1 RNA binding protein, heterogenous nuclear RNP-K like protein [Coemansia sp. RSA 720]KAJ2542405.1 RNA binding protein, heterogenous nuclear RNP-K like protein [Coemansia sp. RSA 1853]KAJ2562540.1 RNA binding protein, heterogenous nuclear RNP-K like protein [Coemansia sp. RSA 1822]